MNYSELYNEISEAEKISGLECSLSPIIYCLIDEWLTGQKKIFDISQTTWKNTKTRKFYVTEHGCFPSGKKLMLDIRPEGSFTDLIIVDLITDEEKVKTNYEKLGAIELAIDENLSDGEHIERVKNYSRAYKFAIYTNGIKWNFFENGTLSSEHDISNQMKLNDLKKELLSRL